MIILVSSSVIVCFLLFLIKFLYEVWWNPIRIEAALRSQGIKGPSYRFFYGNSKDMDKMRNEALMSSSSELSHQMLPRVQPHIYLWTKLHGNCKFFFFPF